VKTVLVSAGKLYRRQITCSVTRKSESKVTGRQEINLCKLGLTEIISVVGIYV
jgi:hypothetical protein